MLHFPTMQHTFMPCMLWDKDNSIMGHASSHFVTKNDNVFHKTCHRSLFLGELCTIDQYFTYELVVLSKNANQTNILIALCPKMQCYSRPWTLSVYRILIFRH